MKIVTFRIYPDFLDTKYYYTIKIFKRKDSMYKYRKLLHKKGATTIKASNYIAMASSFPSNVPGEEYQFGEIIFTEDSAKKSGIVSHEMTHAALYWMISIMGKTKAKTIVSDPKIEEMYCGIQGDLVRQYWRKWYKAYKKII